MPPPTRRRADDAEPTIGEVLRKMRAQRSMSQPALARLAGVSPGYIGMLETGERGNRPSRDKVVAFAQALCTSPAEYRMLMRAAGFADEMGTPSAAETFRRAVTTDPFLRADQKRILLATYDSFVGKLAG
jgi:transcriptional regulator with XRE-family HTH domain